MYFCDTYFPCAFLRAPSMYCTFWVLAMYYVCEVGTSSQPNRWKFLEYQPPYPKVFLCLIDPIPDKTKLKTCWILNVFDGPLDPSQVPWQKNSLPSSQLSLDSNLWGCLLPSLSALTSQTRVQTSPFCRLGSIPSGHLGPLGLSSPSITEFWFCIDSVYPIDSFWTLTSFYN